MNPLESFEEQRPLLFGIAYRMLSSAMDAEDIVQEAYLRYQRLAQPPDNPRAYLRTVVTRLCLDQLKSAREQREQYYGEWLPEPILTDSTAPVDPLTRAENISVAFLVVLETLSPLERAVFLLREVFDYDYADIATMLDRSEAACRQTFSRARRHVQAHRPRFDTSPEIHERLVTGFINALQTGDLNNLTTLLAADAILHSDGGGKVPAAVHPIVGRERILAFMAGLAHQALKIGLDYRLEAVRLNGELGLVGRDAVTGEVFLAATFEVFGEQITTLRYVRNPDKLVRLASS